MIDASDYNQAARPRHVSAGTLAILLHGGAFLLLAWLAPPARNLPSPEAERPVHVVLVRPATERRDHDPDRDEPQADPASRATVAVAAADVPRAATGLSREAMHKLVTPQFALPEATNAPGSLPIPGITTVRPGQTRIPLAGDPSSFLADERARLQAGRPQGDAAKVALFGGQPSTGRSFVFLIDRSKSMGHDGLGALEAAEHELLVALQPLQPHHKFQVIAYHHQCVYLHRRELLPATEENKRSVLGFLSGLAAFGATEHEMGLQSALRHLPDVVYLLSDGGDPELTDPQLRRITKSAGGRTTIHCVEFGFGVPPSEGGFLRRLASMNGGGYSYVTVSRP